MIFHFLAYKSASKKEEEKQHQRRSSAVLLWPTCTYFIHTSTSYRLPCSFLSLQLSFLRSKFPEAGHQPVRSVFFYLCREKSAEPRAASTDQDKERKK